MFRVRCHQIRTALVEESCCEDAAFLRCCSQAKTVLTLRCLRVSQRYAAGIPNSESIRALSQLHSWWRLGDRIAAKRLSEFIVVKLAPCHCFLTGGFTTSDFRVRSESVYTDRAFNLMLVMIRDKRPTVNVSLCSRKWNNDLTFVQSAGENSHESVWTNLVYERLTLNWFKQKWSEFLWEDASCHYLYLVIYLTLNSI